MVRPAAWQLWRARSSRAGRPQVVTCSGIDAQGSLRIVRNGIGLLEHSAAEMPGIRCCPAARAVPKQLAGWRGLRRAGPQAAPTCLSAPTTLQRCAAVWMALAGAGHQHACPNDSAGCRRGMWNLRPSFGAAHDEFLVITFVGDTRVLQLSIDDELGEADLDCFDCDSQVLRALGMRGEACRLACLIDPAAEETPSTLLVLQPNAASGEAAPGLLLAMGLLAARRGICTRFLTRWPSAAGTGPRPRHAPACLQC